MILFRGRKGEEEDAAVESQSRARAAASNMLGCQIEVGMRWRQITPAALTTGCPNDKQPNETKVEVLDIFDKMKVVDPPACFSDRGLSHRTFDQVIDTKFGSVVGPRS